LSRCLNNTTFLSLRVFSFYPFKPTGFFHRWVLVSKVRVALVLEMQPSQHYSNPRECIYPSQMSASWFLFKYGIETWRCFLSSYIFSECQDRGICQDGAWYSPGSELRRLSHRFFWNEKLQHNTFHKFGFHWWCIVIIKFHIINCREYISFLDTQLVSLYIFWCFCWKIENFTTFWFLVALKWGQKWTEMTVNDQKWSSKH